MSDTCACCEARRLEAENEAAMRQSVQYEWQDLKERIELLKELKGDVILSNQYGMVFLLTQDNRILLNLSPLLSKAERLRHA
jgi:hypothetical protein